jgi:hypothetical protein
LQYDPRVNPGDVSKSLRAKAQQKEHHMATGTLGSSARDYHTRQTHYLSLAIAGTGNFGVAATVKIGTIPATGFIVRIQQANTQVFNGTTPVISIGTAASGAQLVASATGGMTALGTTTLTLVSTAAGPFTADQDIYVTNGTTGTITTGAGYVSVEYILP